MNAHNEQHHRESINILLFRSYTRFTIHCYIRFSPYFFIVVNEFISVKDYYIYYINVEWRNPSSTISEISLRACKKILMLRNVGDSTIVL